MIYVSGPGHGGPAVVGNTYLEGTYSEIYPNISQRMRPGFESSLFSFRFLEEFQSHASPECPGSIHEGGELGYSLSHSFGACSTIPISSWPASSAMARRRRVRWPPPGIRTSFSIQ